MYLSLVCCYALWVAVVLALLIFGFGMVSRTMSPDMWKVVVTDVPVEGGVVDFHVDGFLNGSSKVSNVDKTLQNILVTQKGKDTMK